MGENPYFSPTPPQETSFHYTNIQNGTDLLPYLPRQFEYQIQSFRSMEDEKKAALEVDNPDIDSSWFHADIRLKVHSSKELLEWQEMFERVSNTKWNRSKGVMSQEPAKGRQITFKLSLECQHSKRNKVKEYQRNRQQKNMNCKATMYLRIRRDSDSAKYKDPFYGYFGHVSIKWTHAHPLGRAKSLNHLRNPQLKELFETQYFEQGVMPAAACRARSEYLQTLPGFDPEWLENRSICPDRRQAWHWFNIWRKSHPLPLPPTVSKRNSASRPKRDDLVAEIADLLTQRFTLLTGNPSNLEVETLQNLRDHLAVADTKPKLLHVLTVPEGAPVWASSDPPLPIQQTGKRKLGRETLLPEKRVKNEPVYVVEQGASSSALFEEEVEEFTVDVDDLI